MRTSGLFRTQKGAGGGGGEPHRGPQFPKKRFHKTWEKKNGIFLQSFQFLPFKNPLLGIFFYMAPDSFRRFKKRISTYFRFFPIKEWECFAGLKFCVLKKFLGLGERFGLALCPTIFPFQSPEALNKWFDSNSLFFHKNPAKKNHKGHLLKNNWRRNCGQCIKKNLAPFQQP